MKGCWFFSLALCLTGCMASNGLQYQAVSDTNQYHIAKIRKGMSERQVLQIMHKPYSYETFQIEDDIYDVWFYVTRPTGLDQTRMVAQNLTPLTFKNGVLVGTGYSWYYYAMKGQAAESAAQNPEEEKPKTQEAEDKEFEKTLKSNIQKPTPQQDSMQKTSVNETLPPNVHISSGEQVLKTQLDASAPVTKKKFSKARKGMSKEEVMRLLGPPASKEVFSIQDHEYHVWFYEVDTKNKSGSIETFPLTFKEGSLIGTTTKEYNALKEQADPNQTKKYDRGAERMEEGESEQNFNYW